MLLRAAVAGSIIPIAHKAPLIQSGTTPNITRPFHLPVRCCRVVQLLKSIYRASRRESGWAEWLSGHVRDFPGNGKRLRRPYWCPSPTFSSLRDFIVTTTSAKFSSTGTFKYNVIVKNADNSGRYDRKDFKW